MGWSHCGTDEDGRDIGYGIQAVCDEEGCDKEIDRGLAYVCGDMHGGSQWGCGRYFCGKHLFMGPPGQMCDACYEAYAATESEEEEI